jgi:hypothetical protein
MLVHSTRSALVGALVATLSLTACDHKSAPVTPPAPPPSAPEASPAAAPTPAPPACPPETQVNITKVDEAAAANTITINLDPVVIPKVGQGGARWHLPRGFSFTADGITFPSSKNTASPPGATSDASGIGGSPSVFAWCFNTPLSTTVNLRYTVTFTKTGTSSPVWKCDPTVVNQGSVPGGGASSPSPGPTTVSCTVQ